MASEPRDALDDAVAIMSAQYPYWVVVRQELRPEEVAEPRSRATYVPRAPGSTTEFATDVRYFGFLSEADRNLFRARYAEFLVEEME